MGWTFTKTQLAPRQYLADAFTMPDGDRWGDRLRQKVVGVGCAGSTYYVAIDVTEEAGGRYVTCAIVLTETRGRGQDRSLGYKAMSEDMGPYEAKCPAAILKMLSPLPEIEAAGGHVGYAAAWRAKCAAATMRTA